jgi:hypothetical protein
MLQRWWATFSFIAPSFGGIRNLIVLLRFVGGRSLAQVKILLDASVADHGGACGCHFLLGGVIMDWAVPPLEGKHPMWQSEMVASPVSPVRRCVVCSLLLMV